MDSVVLPGADGSIGVLPRHAPMLSALGRGVLKATVDGEPTYFILNEGVAEVGANRVLVMIDRVIAARDAQDASDKLDELRLSIGATPMP